MCALQIQILIPFTLLLPSLPSLPPTPSLMSDVCYEVCFFKMFYPLTIFVSFRVKCACMISVLKIYLSCNFIPQWISVEPHACMSMYIVLCGCVCCLHVQASKPTQFLWLGTMYLYTVSAFKSSLTIKSSPHPPLYTAPHHYAVSIWLIIKNNNYEDTKICFCF